MIKKILLFLALTVSTFAFKIDSVDFDKVVKFGKFEEKTYTVYNDHENPMRYEMSIEGEEDNVRIIPSSIVVPSKGEKSFKIRVEGHEKGKGKYYLLMKEENIKLEEKKGNIAKVRMTYRIEHKYSVE